MTYAYKRNDRVVIINPASMFRGQHGTVIDFSGGVWHDIKIDNRPGSMAFTSKELEPEVSAVPAMTKDELRSRLIALLAVDYVARGVDKEVSIQAAIDDAESWINNIDLLLEALPLLQQYKDSNV